jgi:hypothetical protein
LFTHGLRLMVCLAAAALFAAGATPARAGAPAAAGERADALEVLADLTLIDGTCRDVTVNFGAGFRFASDQGIAAVAVLPGGPQRSAFERVLRERRASFGRDELCGEIAENYAEALPGSVTQSVRRGARP